ncbi:hypothetical protein CONCODRAFT_83032 [Conidiobolus coronatus NRRL 28638]|uniref:Arrestin C-terminal-like domain-containing protein n=1 Tax=Conidiobolus coronatus (strain ATCC 28846 / CBS 209.66 / NRRL 28638) TaxID=796925 RepID=A0A137PH42_CONC2|nr:hypothetical protein CONCODRAFT_83032 [Conidiobolus coronatus NRRL 28638]|eukprot:KXN74326.1 hypothetical protein CONCODRAFT_83032 [Conidiobolus coronatus NRRL 28638]
MKDLLNLLNSLSFTNSLKVDLKLLSDGIYVPKLTEEYEQFSIQGDLQIHCSYPKTINKITLKFKGCIDRLRSSESTPQKSVIIENEMELLSSSINLDKGDSVLSFEMELPRSLLPSIDSEYFKLSYTMIALVETESSKIPFNFPVKVYNHHLIPHIDLRLNSYNDSGSIEDVMDYTVDFPKRFYSKDELIPLKMFIELENNVQLNYITATLSQKVELMDYSTQTPISKTPYLVDLSKETEYFRKKLSTYSIEFYLRIPNSSEKLLVPTLDSSYFEVCHQVQISVNYQVEGKPLTKYLNIKVPVAISTQIKNSFVELPDYRDLDLVAREEGDKLLGFVGELPPIYSV